MSAPFYHLPALQQACQQALESATGKPVILTQEWPPAATSPYRVLVRVGILGPALGGQCVLEMPLLTALNLSAIMLCGKNFSSLNSDTGPVAENLRRRLFGMPYPGSSSEHSCTDAWVKHIEINLGPLYDHLRMRIAIVDGNSGSGGKMRIQLGDERTHTYPLNAHQQVEFDLEGRTFKLTALDTQRVRLDIDESGLTLGSVPSRPNEHQLITQIQGQHYLVRAGSSLVKSLLFELTNQITPSLIPSGFIGDISTPVVIPSRDRHLPLPELQRYVFKTVIMGLGPLGISLELRELQGLNTAQLHTLQALFNFTFYHPELKKIFGK